MTYKTDFEKARNAFIDAIDEHGYFENADGVRYQLMSAKHSRTIRQVLQQPVPEVEDVVNINDITVGTVLKFKDGVIGTVYDIVEKVYDCINYIREDNKLAMARLFVSTGAGARYHTYRVLRVAFAMICGD